MRGQTAQRIERAESVEYIAIMALAQASADGGTIFNLPIIGVRPIDGTSDDWPRLMGQIVPAANALGQTVVMLPGLSGQQWQCLSSVKVPSGSTIRVSRQAVINVNLAGTTANDTPFTLAQGTLTSTTPLATDAASGETSIASPISVPVNSIIALQSTTAAIAMRYKVLAVTGSGPFTLTLDRPINFTGFTVANGTTISILTGASDGTLIDGGGATVKGVKAGGLMTALLSYRCIVKNFVFDATSMAFHDGAGAGLSFLSTLESYVKRVTVLSLAGVFGLGLISSESSLVELSRMSGGNEDGYFVKGSVLSTLADCIGDTNAQSGAHISASSGCVVRGGSYNANSFPVVTEYGGVWIENGSAGTKVIGVTCNYNATAGLFVDSTIAAVTDTSVSCCDLQNNSNSFEINTGSLRTKLSQIDGSGNPFGGLSFGDTVIDQYTSGGGALHEELTLEPQSGSIVVVTNTRITVTSAGVYAIFAAGPGSIRVSKSQLSLNAVTTGVHMSTATPGVFAIEDTTIDGSGATGSTGLSVGPSWSFRIGANLNADACTTPFAPAGGSFPSRAQFTATALTPVSVAFPDLKSTDRVTTKVHTFGTITTNPPEPLIVQTAGVGFTASSIASDTSTYDYTIL